MRKARCCRRVDIRIGVAASNNCNFLKVIIWQLHLPPWRWISRQTIFFTDAFYNTTVDFTENTSEDIFLFRMIVYHPTLWQKQLGHVRLRGTFTPTWPSKKHIRRTPTLARKRPHHRWLSQQQEAETKVHVGYCGWSEEDEYISINSKVQETELTAP